MAKKLRIRPIAICLFRHQDRILVHDGYDSTRGIHLCRPLGGGIDFGETSEAAVVREIREELGVAMVEPQLLGVLESIYTYRGEPGHELVFVYDGQFADATLYEQPVLTAIEGDRPFQAHWRSLETLRSGHPLLVPEKLWSFL